MCAYKKQKECSKIKRTKKLFALLLSGIMVLGLIGSALALKDGDPNECPYCGIGTYKEHIVKLVCYEIKNKVPCVHTNKTGYWDGDLVAVYYATMQCSNKNCSEYNNTPPYLLSINEGRTCTYKNPGMSLGGEHS